jgi:hypothetical protein
MEDAPVPPSRPVLRCGHNEEAHVKQSRYPSTVTHAYYYCRYTVVSIYFFLFNLIIYIFHHSIVSM